MIGAQNVLWGHIDGGRIDVAVPIEDVDLLAEVLSGAPAARLDRELLSMVRPRDLVFDLGASVGGFSLVASARGARVVAVEASPRRAEHLQLSATMNDSTRLVVEHAAVGRKQGSARYLTRHSHRRVVEGSSSNDLVAIPATTVADLVARYGPPALVRVHTPGWEIDVLTGAEGALDAARTIGVRADLAALAARGQNWRGLVALLAGDERPLSWLDGPHSRPVHPTRPHPESGVDLVIGSEPASADLTDDARVVRYESEATQRVGAVRARLAADLRDGGDLLDDARVQAMLERLLLDPAERVVRAVTWWRTHPARRTTLVDRARALQTVLATRLSLD